jgi:hypothetical protein
VLASGPLYSSSVFWAVAGVAVAVATLAIITIQWRAAASRRVLTYSLVSDTALLKEGAREKAAGLRVMLDDKVLNEPHVVSVRVEFRGRNDIERAEYDGSEPLTVDLGTTILMRLDQGSGREKPTVSVNAESVAIGPELIRSGQIINIDLLTVGPANLTCPNPPLANVTIRESQIDDNAEPPWLKRVQTAAFTLFVVGLFGWWLSEPGPVPFSFVMAVFLFGILGFTISITRALISARRRRGHVITVKGGSKYEI